jgi:hypothetical protein
MEQYMFKLSLVILVLLRTNISIASICAQWDKPSKVGEHSKEILEASGVATSINKKEYYIWLNDSGNPELLFASKSNGIITKTVKLSNFTNYDFEAVEQGPCPSDKKKSCLFVADIGNNLRIRPKSKIAVFLEDDFWNQDKIEPILVKRFRSFKNFEAMIINKEGEAHLFSKTKTGVSKIYKLNFIENSTKLTEVSSLDMTNVMKDHTLNDMQITDAAYSSIKDTILILTYKDIIEVRAQNIFNNINSSRWVKGRDYNLIKFPKDKNLIQMETIAYSSMSNRIIISSETESSNLPPPPIVEFNCQKDLER